jgi:hypothetical protein
VKQLKAALEDYLKKTGYLGSITLGPKEEHRVSEADSLYLINLLTQRAKFANYLVIIIVVMLCTLYLGTFIALLKFSGDLKSTPYVLIGGVTLLLAITKQLQNLYAEKSVLDILLASLYQLPPERAADFAHVVYQSIKNPAHSLKKSSSELPEI